jgi:hypothetical protein
MLSCWSTRRTAAESHARRTIAIRVGRVKENGGDFMYRLEERIKRISFTWGGCALWFFSAFAFGLLVSFILWLINYD